MLLDPWFKGVILKDHEKIFYIDKLLKLILNLPIIQLQNEPKCISTAPIQINDLWKTFDNLSQTSTQHLAQFSFYRL